MLVEEYVPGVEVAVEGILHDERCEVLAVFDKPDPLVGPYFEETIYVTPSRLERSMLLRAPRPPTRVARRSGSGEGPVHAEIRVDGERVVGRRGRGPLDRRLCAAHVAVRRRHQPGGAGAAPCARDAARRRSPRAGASGVMMLPIPRAACSREVARAGAGPGRAGRGRPRDQRPGGRRSSRSPRATATSGSCSRRGHAGRSSRAAGGRRGTGHRTIAPSLRPSLQACASSSSRDRRARPQPGSRRCRRRAPPRAGHEVAASTSRSSPGTRRSPVGRRVACSVPMHTATRLAREVAGRIATGRSGASGCTRMAPTCGAVATTPGTRGWIEEGPVAVHRPRAPRPPPAHRYARLVDRGEERAGRVRGGTRRCAHRCRHCPVPVVYDGRMRARGRRCGGGRRRAAGRHGRAAHHVRRSRLPQRGQHYAPHRAGDARRFPTLTFDCTVKVEHVLRYGASPRRCGPSSRRAGACSSSPRSSRSDDVTSPGSRRDTPSPTRTGGRDAPHGTASTSALLDAVHAVDHRRRRRGAARLRVRARPRRPVATAVAVHQSHCSSTQIIARRPPGSRIVVGPSGPPDARRTPGRHPDPALDEFARAHRRHRRRRWSTATTSGRRLRAGAPRGGAPPPVDLSTRRPRPPHLRRELVLLPRSRPSAVGPREPSLGAPRA